MISAIGSVINFMISWIGQVFTALVNAGDGNTDPGGAWHALLPLFAIGIVASLLMFSMKMIRKVTWGS